MFSVGIVAFQSSMYLSTLLILAVKMIWLRRLLMLLIDYLWNTNYDTTVFWMLIMAPIFILKLGIYIHNLNPRIDLNFKLDILFIVIFNLLI